MKTALVTGANRGLGKETARQLEQRGFRVITTSREDPAFPLDVTSDASVRALTEKLERAKIVLDVLVNNAGIAMKGFDANVVKKTLETNFFGPLRVTDALLPLVPDGGNIVMVSSGMGELSIFDRELRAFFAKDTLDREALVQKLRAFVADQTGWPRSAYSVSKAGLNALTRILARELAPRRIRVNAVCPGWVRTDMGGEHAERDVQTGAKSIVWAALLDRDGPTGGFFRDGKAIAF
jgi:NAD(P)-dependent dehydrogenase (short-subunit alcohol dehydrogenase family)